MPDDPTERPMEEYEEWRNRADDGDLPPKETFRKISQIALLLSYDLVDKLRYWEKETLTMPDEAIVERIAHMEKSLEQLRTAYLTFAELDF